jgi:hypothetical protein
MKKSYFVHSNYKNYFNKDTLKAADKFIENYPWCNAKMAILENGGNNNNLFYDL